MRVCGHEELLKLRVMQKFLSNGRAHDGHAALGPLLIVERPWLSRMVVMESDGKDVGHECDCQLD